MQVRLKLSQQLQLSAACLHLHNELKASAPQWDILSTVKKLVESSSGGHAKVRVTSAGGVENPAHLCTLAGQFVVFSDSLLRLEDFHINAFLLHKVQGGGGNLLEETMV